MRMDEETTITRGEIEEYNRYVRYVQNWYPTFVKCKVCGEFNPPGYVCINCGGVDLFSEENEDGED